MGEFCHDCSAIEFKGTSHTYWLSETSWTAHSTNNCQSSLKPLSKEPINGDAGKEGGREGGFKGLNGKAKVGMGEEDHHLHFLQDKSLPVQNVHI